MAMTQLALLFIGALALIGTLGMFYQFGDRYTGVLVEMGAAALWALFAISSMDVIVRDTSWATASESITPLVYLGIGMAVLAFVFGLYDLLDAIGSDAGAIEDIAGR